MMMREPEDYFTGGGLLPFLGVVENVNDPRQTGRVQVRALAYHPEKGDQGVPTEHLPWAYVLAPTTSPGMSGIGSTHDLKDGSWVFGFFLDGRDAQQPFIIGSFLGMPSFTPDQRALLQQGLGIASMAPGGLSAAFQTLIGGAVGGLGPGGKFGATTGSALDLSKFLENSDAVKTLQSLKSAQEPSLSWQPPEPVVNAFNSLTSDKIQRALAGQDFTKSTSGAGTTAMGFQGLGDSVFTAGGANTGTVGQPGPLSAATVGTTGQQGGQGVTADTQVDYDAYVNTWPKNTGMVTIHCSATPKHANYTLSDMARDHAARRPVSQGGTGGMDGKGIGYHAVIMPSGQITQTRDPNAIGSHVAGYNHISVGGQTMQNIGICLVGGLPVSGQQHNLMRLPLDSKFYMVQFATLEKVIRAAIKRFPKIKVAGHNEFSSKECPTFKVGEWMRHISPQNANDQGGVAGAGSVPQSGGVDPRNGDTTGTGEGDDFTQVGGTSSNRVRGFQGGVSHPIPVYAGGSQPDWPAQARGNALTGGRGGYGKGTASGGPLQQYLAKLDEPSQYVFKKARAADSLEARSVPEDWKVPTYQHGGEYNQAHVVRSTEGGHHVLLDDTAGRNKIELLHAGGSMMQVHNDGTGVFYFKKDKFEVIVGDDYVGISGDCHLSVGGDLRISVKGDYVLDVAGKASFNVNGDAHELVMGDKRSAVAGHQLIQTKKNHSVRVGKDHDVSVGGKHHQSVKGTSHEHVQGNHGRTIMGESSDYVGGNKSSLTKGTQSSHAAHAVEQVTGERVIASKGNLVISAAGKGTLVSNGDMRVTGAKIEVTANDDLKVKAQNVDVKATSTLKVEGDSAVHVKSGGELHASGTDVHSVASGTSYITASSAIHAKSGDNKATPPWVDGAQDGTAASSASEPEKTTAADVDKPPAQLTRESTTADSEANLNAEQAPYGEIDKAVAVDEKGSSGGTPPGAAQSGGSSGSGDNLFSQSTGGGPVSPTSLGNSKGDACAIANDLVAKGWTPQGASAAVGNMIQESSLNPGALVTDTNGKLSGGLIQWNGQRLTNLQNFSQQNGMDWRTTDAQVAYLDYEARTSHSGQGGFGMIGAGNMTDAIGAAANFERFAGYSSYQDGIFTGGGWGDRAGNSLGVYNECFGGAETGVGGVQPGDVSGFTGGSNTNNGDWSTGTGTEVMPAKGVKPPYSPLPTTLDYKAKVSPNFTLGDMCPTSHPQEGMNKTGSGSLSSTQIITNLSGVAVNVCEVVLAGLGKCSIMSGYRSYAYNTKVGGAKNSDHMKGQAVDMLPPNGMSVEQFAQWIEKNIPNIAGIGRYPTHSTPFVHVSFYITGNNGRIRRWSA
jgi:hypothetical protein